MKQKSSCLLFLICIIYWGFAQNQSGMVLAFKKEISKGKNSSIKYKELEITPINLFVQERPINERLVHIQLELNVKEVNNEFNTFLWYNEKGLEP